jgi:hypothetical protein
VAPPADDRVPPCGRGAARVPGVAVDLDVDVGVEAFGVGTFGVMAVAVAVALAAAVAVAVVGDGAVVSVGGAVTASTWDRFAAAWAAPVGRREPATSRATAATSTGPTRETDQ